MIPRIIHQSWKNRSLPSQYEGYVNGWKELHPQWEYRLWTDDDNQRLVEQHYSWLLPVYLNYPLAIQRADMARVLYLHRFGGVYADIDFECLRSFEDFAEEPHVVLGREKGGLGWFRRGRDYVSNALMASPPGHPFWKTVLQSMCAKSRCQRFYEPRVSYVLSTTGPEVIDAVVEAEQQEDLQVYPSEFFFPASCMEKNADRRRQAARVCNAHGVHHSANSWFSLPMHATMWAGHLLRAPFSR